MTAIAAGLGVLVGLLTALVIVIASTWLDEIE